MDPNHSAMSADDADRSDPRTGEPEGLSQQDQLNALREEGSHDDVRFDMAEDEEMRLLEAEFGPPGEDGVFRAREEGEAP